jgi:hypothetical protein
MLPGAASKLPMGCFDPEPRASTTDEFEFSTLTSMISGAA